MALPKSVCLCSAGVEVCIDLTAGTPNVIHWGRPIGKNNPEALEVSQLDPAPHCDFDEPQVIGIWRENARGFLGRPTVIGSRNGADFSQLFALADVIQNGNNDFTFVSVDADANLEVRARFVLDSAGMLQVSQSIKNHGDDFNLESLTTFLPVPDRVTDTLDFTGRWMNERQPQRNKLQVGSWTREGREGRTGHDYTLVQFALAQGTTFEHGEAWGLSLAWSGNNRHIIERTPLGRTSIGAGELLLPGEVVLAHDETYEAPTVWAVYSSNGINEASDRFHSSVRARRSHSRPRPVTLNVWEAVYFDHDLAKLSALAEKAAEIGVERFVLDDGWFGARRDDHAGLGDWVVSKEVWPNGLKPLIDKVKSEGLEFGLWFEGEMVNEDSDLYRAHPEWILQSGGRVPPTFRDQQVLDLSHPGAYAHVFDQTNAILSEYDIAYIKWDHNRVLTEPGHFDKPTVRKQTQAIYRLFDELKAAHPGLEIESCASGGGRIDLGMIDHADRFWTSDNNDALERQGIQRYTTIVIPPEYLGTHIGPTKAHSTGRTLSISFRGATALWGHAGLEWDLTKASEAELESLKTWITYYKANRELLHTGKVVRVDQSEENAWQHGVVAKDGSRAIFSAVQLRPSQYSRPTNLRLHGLDENATYRVKVVTPAGPAEFMNLHLPAWMSQELELSGAFLSAVGLKAPVLRPEQALLIEATRI
jgi:alpha-galactosidase